MSTWIYLVCEQHDEPVRANYESGQHLYDLPQLRLDWLNRRHWLAYIERFPGTLTREFDLLTYFQRHTFAFLRDHADCDQMHVVTEYGERLPLAVTSIEGLLQTDGQVDRRDDCQSVCWMSESGRDAECSLPEGHDGPHVDQDEGWEW